MQKSLFFLRPFYVLSTSFLRNGYMEVRKVHKVYIITIEDNRIKIVTNQ